MLLMAALHTHDQGLCVCGCGQYSELAHDPDTDGWWEVETMVCNAGAALADWDEREGKTAESGTMRYVRFDSEGYAKRVPRR